MARVYNFNAGPSAMPLDVLKEVQAEFLDVDHCGMSVVEISHRSAEFEKILQDAKTMVRRLLNVPEDYHIVFIQGGGTMQFFMSGANFLKTRGGYLNTGLWASKALKAASFFGEAYEVASSADRNFSYIPKPEQFVVKDGTDYVHMTSNNTAHGTEWLQFPKFDVPVICDMSSDFMARPVDVSQFDLIYAGVQKNVGPAGVITAIVKDSFLQQARRDIPEMLQYKAFVDKDSTYNTPPIFCIYFTGKVLHWIEDHGGTQAMWNLSTRKANILYDAIDSSDGYYIGHAVKDSRSHMNVTFNLGTPELEKKFIAEALENGLAGVGGHRTVGGCRVSIYNAVTEDACTALADFMKAFRRNN